MKGGGGGRDSQGVDVAVSKHWRRVWKIDKSRGGDWGSDSQGWVDDGGGAVDDASYARKEETTVADGIGWSVNGANSARSIMGPGHSVANAINGE